ncbi:HNH endonuclease [Priestia megaterium]
MVKLSSEEKTRRLKERQQKKWNETHEIIDGVDYKKCSICEEFKIMEDNFYKSNTNSVDLHSPWCKECAKKKAYKWTKDNPEKYKVFYTARNQKPYFKKKMIEAANKQRREGKQKEWVRNNPEKIKQYVLRREGMKHVFSEEEWVECKFYFNWSCAYCGMHEADNMIKYTHRLHRDHVIHTGSNDLENCVPACVKCNVSKSDNDFNDWYNEHNVDFTKRRLNKIINWMTKDFMNVIG